MHCINVNNVNQGLSEGLRLLANLGRVGSSRNGAVLYMNEPVATTYEICALRVLFSPERNANPFFHLMESLWILAGRNDLAWVRMFNKQMKAYSDDGKTLHGAYGYRWRRYFGVDQLTGIISMLRAEPATRQAVLGMWSPYGDLAADSKDIPCNDLACFDMRDGKVNMTVMCRSNDIWWGCYGANAVHFSMLLEYVAGCVGAPVGRYTQISNNFHLYPDIVMPARDLGPPSTKPGARQALCDLADKVSKTDQYTHAYGNTGRRLPVPGHFHHVPLITMKEGGVTQRDFDNALDLFMEDAAGVHHYPFFRDVAAPMYRAWVCYKLGSYGEAEEHVLQIRAGDWALACMEWLDRRKLARLE